MFCTPTSTLFSLCFWDSLSSLIITYRSINHRADCSTHSINKATIYQPQYQPPILPVAATVEGSWGYSSGGFDHRSHWLASPQYSSSTTSGYGSPNYGSLTLPFAGQPHAQLLDRQRSFSDTSLIEQCLPQQVATTKSQPSPTPSIIDPFWTEWNTEEQNREYSIPTTSLAHESRSTSFHRTPSLTSYPLNFPVIDISAITYIQRDMYEGTEFGLQDIDDVLSEQYLDQYWRLLHPQYPVLHRPTFSLSTASPILKAAVLAIGSHYLLDYNARQDSRRLHEQCSKILAKVSYSMVNIMILN